MSDKDKQFIGAMYPFRSVPVKLVIGAPQTRQVISATRDHTALSLPINDAGQYRIWTSLINGTITVTDAHDVVVATGQQQVTFDAQMGLYNVNINPEDPSVLTAYRIRAAKIG